jgi:WD40 repeat protein
MYPQAALPAQYVVTGVGVVREPGGDLVLCACTATNILTRWDAQTLRPLDRVRLASPVRCFSPDGRLGLAAWSGNSAQVIDLGTGAELKRFPEVLPGNGGGAFSADGKKALVAVAKGQFSLLETATGKELWRFHGARGVVRRLALTPSGKHVLSLDETGSVWQWDAATSTVVRRFVPGPGGNFIDLALSADGRRLLLLTSFGFMELWDLEDGRKIRSLRATGDSPSTVAMTPDGRRALTGSAQGRVRLWDLERGEELCARAENATESRCVALSPDGRLVLSGHYEQVILHDALSQQVVKALREQRTWIQSVAFSPDGSHFAYGDENGELYLRQSETTRLVWRQRAHPRYVRGLVFSTDGKRLFSAGGNPSARASLQEGAIRVWDAATGRPAGALEGHTAAVGCLALSPDGTRLLSGGRNDGGDFTVRLWDVASGKQLACFEGHTGYMRGVAFAPDGKRAVSVSQDGTIRLWDLEAAPALAGRILAERTVTQAVAFVGEERFVTACDLRLLMWDVGGAIVADRPLPYLVNGLGPSRDGKHLATANGNGTVYLLRLPLRGR